MSEAQAFLDGRVTLHAGDCLAVVKTLPDNSIDAAISDPPYALVSIGKRFGADGAAPCKAGATGVYQRASAGFMGKRWDTGETAFAVEFWREVFRVLKPGAHVVAFGGTRSYHRLACAIEDAGFEIRDQIGWAYGSGFPKSHDVSKGIDKALGAERQVVAAGAPVKRMIPGADQNKSGWEKTDGREFIPTVTAPASDRAAAWEGWGTALKPAWEPICLARKPLSEATVAANVLRWGTGAINVNGCRIATDDRVPVFETSGGQKFEVGCRDQGVRQIGTHGLGRWPANIVHDGSAEVVTLFPESKAAPVGSVVMKASSKDGHGNAASAFGAESRPYGTVNVSHGDFGSAARFFYSAKADGDDRLGSKHPTVKPVDLMQWLCRLVTPPGGTILDPFAGTGTTGEAAWREGFNAVLIEREAEYCADVARRMALAVEGKETRRREAAKARHGAKPRDCGPLFGGADHPVGGGKTSRPSEIASRTGTDGPATEPNHRADRAQAVRAAE
ncbi:MAG: DNA methyltransferase [Roseiarcus sp.]